MNSSIEFVDISLGGSGAMSVREVCISGDILSEPAILCRLWDG